jgi:hypothetical protein
MSRRSAHSKRRRDPVAPACSSARAVACRSPRVSCTVPPRALRTASRLPWISWTWELPASWWRPSTFCVTTTTGTACSKAAMARCAGFGAACAIGATTSRKNPASSAGSSRSAASSPGTWAKRSGGNLSQKPPSSRKVAMPLSADTPAPVNTTTCCALRSRSAASRRSSPTGRSLTASPPPAARHRASVETFYTVEERSWWRSSGGRKGG